MIEHLSRRRFLVGVGVGVVSLAVPSGGLLLEGAQSVEAQGAPINPSDIIGVSDKLSGLSYTVIPGLLYPNRHGFEVNVPASEERRLQRAGHQNPKAGIGTVHVGGAFQVVNPNGLQNGVDGASETTAREATLRFTPNPVEIAEVMTVEYAQNPGWYDLPSQDGQAVWLRGTGRVEVVLTTRSGPMFVVIGNVVGDVFGAGSTITEVGVDGSVGATINLAGRPAVFQITVFSFNVDTREFSVDESLMEVYVEMRAADRSQLDVSIGGATSFVDTDGSGAADFRDEGFSTLSQLAVPVQPNPVVGQG